MGDRQCSAVTFGKWQCKIMKDKIVKETIGGLNMGMEIYNE